MKKVGIWVAIIALASMAACADIKADTNTTDVNATDVNATKVIKSSEVSVQSCTGCHGKNFNKKALGKSKIISEMRYNELKASLKGYKAGTYGGPMKGLMKAQVVKYSDAELDAMAMHIARDCDETSCLVK